MFTLSSGDVSYVLPMDYVDLGFFENKSVGDSMKLWSAQQDGYAKFQLTASRSDTDSNLDSEAESTTTCTICNMQVPVFFIKEHWNSRKHKNNLQIIDEVLKRIRNNVNTNLPLFSTVKTPRSDYYCESCSVQVATKDKNAHENSITHKTSIRNDEVVETFLMIYKKGMQYDISANKQAPIKPDLTGFETSLEKLKMYMAAVLFNNEDIGIEVLDENFLIIKVEGVSLNIHVDNFNGFLYKDGKLSCSLCKIVIESKEQHMWSDQHLHYVTMPFVDQHCIRQINPNFAHCMVCNELIKSVGGHKVFDSNHKENLERARDIQSNTLDSIVSYYSLQQVVETVEDTPECEESEEKSTTSNDDKEKESDPKVTETKYVHYLIANTDNPKATLCVVCHCAVPNLYRNIHEHLNGKAHKNMYTELLKNNRLNRIKNGFVCDFCGLLVEISKEVQHISSAYHKINTQRGIKDSKTLCVPCNVYIDTHNLLAHQNGMKHKQNASGNSSVNDKDNAKNNFVVDNKSYAMVATKPVQNAASEKKITENAAKNQVVPGVTSTEDKISPPKNNHYLFKETSNPNERMCKVCNVILLNNSNNLDLHVNGNNHKTKYNNMLHLNKVVKVILNFNCNICNVPITNKNEVDHILGAKHKNAIKDKGNISDNSVNITKPNMTADNEYIDYLYQFESSENNNDFICRVCDVRLTNSRVNIIEHVKGNSHITKYNNLLCLNGIVLSQTRFKCSKCDVFFPTKNEFSHIGGNNHLTAMLVDESADTSNEDVYYSNESMSDNNEDGIYCDFCNIFVARSESLVHKISEEHLTNVSRVSKNTLELQYEFNHSGAELQNKNCTLICKICDCSVGNVFNCVLEHVEGNAHTNSYNKLLENNKICSMGDKLFCLACKEFIASNQELAHIWRANHTGNVSIMK